MKKLNAAALVTAWFCLGAPAQAQSLAPNRVVTCDTTVAPQALLSVQDEATPYGALLLDPALITLPNGMKAVQFSLRHVRSQEFAPAILKVRYTVTWTDDCGRVIPVGANVVNGLALNPKQQQALQSIAMNGAATRAKLHVYVVE